MSEHPVSPAAAHAATVVGMVARSAIDDCGAAGIVLLEPETPQGRLARDWLVRALGEDAVLPSPEAGEGCAPAIDAPELRRAAARVLARERGLLLAHPAPKTVLLLSSDVPPERLLPLGDVYATDVAEWAGGVSLPDDVRALADRAGGLARLDAALQSWLEERRTQATALGGLPPEARAAVAARLRLNRASRRWPRCVPKLGRRTLWIDLIA